MALTTFADIINAACARIGEEPPQSFEDDLGGGQSALLIYEETVEFNLGLQTSGFYFAREVKQLSKVATATPFTGYEHVFDVPQPSLGPPVYLTDDPSNPRRRYVDFLLTNNQVHAADNPLYAMIKFRPDPHRWSPVFKSATITAIAGHLAFAIASDRNQRSDMLQLAYGTPQENFRGGMMRAALTEDGFANPPRAINVSANPLEEAWRD
ncbi:MAG: hypothetical protein ACK4M8_05360 [Allorhizobium sp.]